jgi:uncharacterized protein with FMN-binding domain
MRRLQHTMRVAIALAGTAVGATVLLNGRQTSSTVDSPLASDQTGTVAVAAGTYTGPTIGTQWGPVQVKVTLANGRLTDVVALQTPSSHRRSVSINQRATPILRQEALSVQSAQIDVVSGATITSEAYMESLQAALDAAKG